MSEDPGTTFTIIFEKLAELQDSHESQESRAQAAEAEEIQELRRIVEEANAPDCCEFATS